ncbi:MAG: SIS domain-containing protein [Treponema sp.]|jgi:D-sedoheptulose 7-phosphate isomerase|nr:SIS domain-containing protein [Treponema sp.]
MDYLRQLITRYPALAPIGDDIRRACEILTEAFSGGGKLLVAGNGGSAADSEHIVGELMKSFVRKRKLSPGYVSALERVDPELASYLAPRLQPALPAIALTGHNSLSSACINDIDGNIAFAQQVCGYGNRGDVFLGISTSGNSKNVLYAAAAAKAAGMKVIALTGGGGGRLARIADAAIIVPGTETYRIQELHMPVYHCLCLVLEEHFFP